MLHHGFYILSTQPLIVSFKGTYPFFDKLLHKDDGVVHQRLPEGFRPKHVIEFIPWWAGRWHHMARRKAKQILQKIEGRTHHMIVNSLDEDVLRKRFLIRGVKLNAALYINEHTYKPSAETKHYDAIYTGRLSSFKRHELAKDVECLMVGSYGGNLHAFCPQLQHAEFNKKFLPPSELCKKINQSYAGLCLSAEEGIMRAAIEYLLCGIPVVSTPSKGGRDQFFNEKNSIIVPTESEAVAQAVRRWKESPPDPQAIREQTLNQLSQGRLEFCTYVARLIESEGGEKKDPKELMEKYFAEPAGISSRFVTGSKLRAINLEDFSLNK